MMTTGTTTTTTTQKKTASSKATRARLPFFVALPLLAAAVPQPHDTGTVRIGPDLVVTRAVFGFVNSTTGEIVESDRFDANQHPAFAWKVTLSGRPRTLKMREDFILPAPAQVWQVGAQTRVAPDRASATTESEVQLDSKMEVRNGWIHTPGDPKGPHTMRIWLDGVLVREFDFTLY